MIAKLPTLLIQAQPHCLFPKLRGIPVFLSHGSSFSSFGASGTPDTV